ncbi:MAG: hypothetical protein HY063_14475 [Bacteroidetes bacterium]|nr:hypothetical protein [Bacteroidota bacterium]
MKKIVHITFYFLLLSSCHKDKPVVPPPDLGYAYFPLTIGHYVIYNVDSTVLDTKSNVDTTFRYQLKEVAAELFYDNAGRPTYKIFRYKRSIDTLPWQSTPQQVWTANRTATTAERTEENIRYIKLVFPVKQGKQWNGNAFNILGEKDYEIISLDQKETIGTLSFDSTLTVKQFEQKDLIETIYEAEKYARNAGLVYKERDSLYWGGGDTVGYTFTQKIVSYGK